MDTQLLFIQALSPIHAGTGQGVGVIDNPIAREKSTDIPFIPGATIKGVLRDACEDKDAQRLIFGSAVNDVELSMGAATFTDARLLLLPVRSLRGVFAWVTSPLLLKRLMRDAGKIENVNLPKDVTDNNCLISGNSALKLSDDKVFLEDLDLTSKPSTDVDQWAGWLADSLYGKNSDWHETLKERLCIISDDNLSFLLETATEITARIRLEEKSKTVMDGALWYEEALPVETVLVSMVISKNNTVFDKLKSFSNNTLQFGGNATVGRGLCKATLRG
jgi:CRISPR-associated protein Cmr4